MDACTRADVSLLIESDVETRESVHGLAPTRLALFARKLGPVHDQHLHYQHLHHLLSNSDT